MAGIAAKLARDREAAEGLGSHEKAVKYLNQDYEALRDECLQAGVLFQDPSFPAVPAALGFKELGPYSSKTQGIVWKRPTVGAGARGGAGVGLAWRRVPRPRRGVESEPAPPGSPRPQPRGDLTARTPRGLRPVTRCGRPSDSLALRDTDLTSPLAGPPGAPLGRHQNWGGRGDWGLLWDPVGRWWEGGGGSGGKQMGEESCPAGSACRSVASTAAREG